MSAVCYCGFCGTEMLIEGIEQILDHVREVHPEHYVEPLRWPDGEIVVMQDPDMERWNDDAGR